MSRHRMPSPILQGQNHNFVLRKIIFWKLYAAVENRKQMLRFELLRLRLRSVTLQAKNIRSLGAQQMIVVAAVWLVTGGAPLFEGGLMQHVLLRLLSLIGMACQTDIDRVGLGKARLAAGVRIVAIGTIAGSSRMRNFGLINFFCLIAVAGNTYRFHIRLGQYDFAVFRRRMAQVTRLIGERRMQELTHQFGRG